MESKKINQLATELTPALSDLTIIGDPTTGISKKITLSQMASLFTGTVEEYANLAAFPLVGVADTIYIALDTNVLYRWNTGTNAYVELSPNIINSLVFSDANGFDGNISLVGSTATLTITTALTTGSVPFIGASGALSQDNANLFFDDTNNRLGINTNAPTTALDVFGSGIIGRLNGTSTNNAYLGFASAGTNRWSIGNVQADHRFRIYNEATTSELVSVLQTGEFGIGIANPTTKLHIDGGASALIANLDANVSVAKSLSFRSDNSNRINLEVSGTESGSNAGGNFFIRRYSDAGSLIDTPLTITRSTGEISLSTALSATSATFSAAVVFSSTTSHTGTAGFGIGSPTAIDGSDGRIITNKFRLYNTTPATIYHDFVTAATTNKSITVPDLSGTLALLEGTQTFSGAKTFSSALSGTSATFSGNVTANNGSVFLAVSSLGTVFTVMQSDNTSGYIGTNTNHPLILRTDSTTRLTIASTGAATFSSSVTVGTGINIANDITWTNNTGYGLLAYDGVRFLSYTTAGGTNLGYGGAKTIIQGNGGLVGIGTSSPSALLHVLGGSGVNQPVIFGVSGTTLYTTYRTSTSTDIGYIGSGTGLFAGGSATDFGMRAENNLVFGVSNTERMRITSLGYTKASSNGTYWAATAPYHEFGSNTSANWTTVMFNSSASPFGLYIPYSGGSPNNVGNEAIYFSDSTTVRFSVRSNGGIANFQANDVNLSDERTKKDIIPLESYWNKFKAIEIVKFKYIDQTHDDFNIGVIAQQVEKVAPEFIDIDGWNTKPEFDEEGNEIISEEEPLKSVYTADLHHATIKVLQEAMAKIESLEEKVKQLESK